jgi:hypothetical protein
MMAGLAKHLGLLAGAEPPLVADFTGRLDAAGTEVRARYVGSGVNRDYLLSLVMDEPRERARHCLQSYAQVPRAVSAAGGPNGGEVDVVLTDLPALWSMLTPRRAQYRFPAWVRQELSLPSADAAWVLPRAVEREAARLARRHRYTLDFTNEQDSLHRFYRELYQPYVLARFGSGAIVVAERDFVATSGGCTLAVLQQDGRWTAGMLLERSGAELRFRWFGASCNPPPAGASDVLDVACIRRAHSDGVRTVLLGHSRPSLADGVVRYKQKLGARLCAVRYPQSQLGIAVDKGQPAMFARLNRRRLVAVRGRGLVRILEAS